MDTTIARDGMVAYTLPGWTRDKLHYIERYLDICCKAMRGKWTLVYADMLAGPGLCVDEDTGEEVPGSALLAVRRQEFARLFINDIDPKVTAALAARIGSQPPGRICISTADCNAVVDQARQFLFPPTLAARTLGVAIIDPQAYQMRFDAIAALTEGVRLDLVIVFMTSFARRFLQHPSFASPLTGIIGEVELEQLIERKRRHARLTFGDFLDAFERRLNGIGYPYVYTTTRTENSQRATVYHIVFASRHPLGEQYFKEISQRRWTGQRRMALF